MEVVKRPIVEDSGEGNLSKKKKKKMARNPNKNFDQGNDVYEKCICKNPKVRFIFSFSFARTPK